ncbi:MAG: NlpC/P60 family protein [Hespellia sp.]|nr:NlpC/P60 family protein [Hespellia sp.]
MDAFNQVFFEKSLNRLHLSQKKSSGGVEATAEFIDYAPDVTAEMYHADFWIRRCAHMENVIMDEKQISQLNDKILADDRCSHNIWKQQEISEDYDSDWKTSRELGITLPLGKQPVGYGICVRRADLRAWPGNTARSAEKIWIETDDTSDDKFQLSVVRVNMPVLITRESADGQFYYIITYDYEGWSEKECFAVCRNRGEWIQAQRMEHFLVVTVPGIRLEISGQLLTMGVKLRLLEVEEIQKIRLNRSAWGCYIVAIPQRRPDGYYQLSYAAIPPAIGVHVGYLPYTMENVIHLAFQFLGNRYGWGGMFESVDCSQLVQEVYACFGIYLARDAGVMIRTPGKRISFRGMNVKEKVEELDTLAIGSLLYFPGHIMIYLGKDGDEYYVISAVGSLKLPDKKEPESIQSVIVNALTVQRGNGEIWAQEITDALLIE